MQPTVRRSELFLRRIAADGRGLIGISEQSVGIWHEIANALTPIIGKRGMTALFERALHLAGVPHAWFEETRDSATDTPAFSTLATALQDQPESEAIASMATLFEAFDRLLVGLIGESLTERLLQPIWALPSAGTTVQDTSR